MKQQQTTNTQETDEDVGHKPSLRLFANFPSVSMGHTLDWKMCTMVFITFNLYLVAYLRANDLLPVGWVESPLFLSFLFCVRSVHTCFVYAFGSACP